MVARWTNAFDIQKETQFWYCIKDNVFDISALKAKRRYYVNKGIQNFDTKVLEHPGELVKELFEVYIHSFEGYKIVEKIKTVSDFEKTVEVWENDKRAVLFGAFDKNSGKLCGYSDVFVNGEYLPISSLKTIPEYEKIGVNFALVYAIVTHFEKQIKSGSYLCDGARNVIHETNFQDFLIKYFGFRRAYCTLNIEYRGIVKYIVYCLYPFRHIMKKSNNLYIKRLYAILKQEAWRRGKNE